jgi:hypothetical protein
MSGEGEEELFVQPEADDNLEAQVEGEEGGAGPSTDEVRRHPIPLRAFCFFPFLL